MADFLATPSDEAVARYYAELLARLDHPPVEVRLDSGGGRGKGVFLTKDVARGESVWRGEAPLAGCQSAESRAAVSACAECHACTGTLERHVGEKLVAAVTRAEEDAEEARTARDRKGVADAAKRAARLERAVDPRDLQAWLRPLPSLRDGDDDEDEDEDDEHQAEAERRKLPLSHLLPRRFLRAPAPKPCRLRCGAEFCDAACEARAWDRWHRLLCPGRRQRLSERLNQSSKAKGRVGGSGSGSSKTTSNKAATIAVVEAGVAVDRASVARFLEHADANNDIFRVAGQVVALLLVEADRLLVEGAGGAGGEGAEGREQQQQQQPVTPRAALARAALPFACAHRRPWWECVARPEDVSPGEQEGEFRAQLRSLAADSLELLSAALRPQRPGLAEALLLPPTPSSPSAASSAAAASALDAYGSFVGMFELNNLAINVPPPLEAYVALLNGDALPLPLPPPRGEEEEEEEGRQQQQQQAASSSSAAATADNENSDPPPPTEAERDAASAIVSPLLSAMGGELAGTGAQGTAFYALQSCCNHACAPTARARADGGGGAFVVGGGGGRGDGVSLVAVRDLVAGEELTISYLPLDDEEGEADEDEQQENEEEEERGGDNDDGPRPPPVVPLPLAERREALRDYGFECACERCEAEELAEAIGNC